MFINDAMHGFIIGLQHLVYDTSPPSGSRKQPASQGMKKTKSRFVHPLLGSGPFLLGES